MIGWVIGAIVPGRARPARARPKNITIPSGFRQDSGRSGEEASGMYEWIDRVLLGGTPETVSGSAGLLAARILFGMSMAMTHGRATLGGWTRGGGVSYPDPIGLGPELSMGLMAFAELVCALLVAAGIACRLSLIPLVFGMGVAVVVHHHGDAFADRELAFLYFSGFAALLVAGPGRYSLDHILLRGARRAGRIVAGSAVLFLLLATPLQAGSILTGDLPRRGGAALERIEGVDSIYGVLETTDGARLRTILTKPEGAEDPLPAILFVQWLSCDSIELPGSKEDGWSRMLRQIAARSGMVMLRTEKSGVGDSEGPPCAQLGSDRELGHHREALEWLRRSPHVDASRIVIFGASMGATMAPLLAAESDVAAVVVWGGGAKTWLERTLGFERRFRELTAVPADQMTREMQWISRFLPSYLIESIDPAQLAGSDPAHASAWKALIGTEGWTQYGRSPSFHQEAQRRDWAAAWARVDVPVLVLYGEADWYEDRAGHELIVRLVNQNRPGLARLAVIPSLDHHFVQFPSAEAAARDEGGWVAEGAVVEEIMPFLGRVAKARSAGLDALRRARAALGSPSAIALAGEGTIDPAAQLQGYRPDSDDAVPFREELAVTADGRVGYESRYTRRDGTEEWLRFGYAGREMQFVQMTEGFAARVADPAFEDAARRLARMLPQVLLEDALGRAATVRLVESLATLDRVSFVLVGGERLTLDVDRNGFVTAFEYRVDLPLSGDTVIRWVYDDYRRTGDLLLPAGYSIFIGGRPWKRVQWRAAAHTPSDSAVFEIPEGVPVPPAPQPPSGVPAAGPEPRVVERAPGIWQVQRLRSGFHPIFIELDEYVVAFEAPTGWLEMHEVPASNFTEGATSSSVAEELIRLIHETVPGKPIRSVVLSHFHNDHSGGVRAFIAEGATVVTTAPGRAVVERAIRNPHTIHPDRLSREPRTAKLEVVSGKHVITDGSRRVELIEVENEHAAGMLVAWVPAEKLLFVSDLFLPLGKRFPSKAELPMNLAFVRWLDRSGLDPEIVLAIHGSSRGTAEQLDILRRLARPAAP